MQQTLISELLMQLRGLLNRRWSAFSTFCSPHWGLQEKNSYAQIKSDQNSCSDKIFQLKQMSSSSLPQHTHIHALTHALTHTCTHAHIHSHTCTHTHTRSHTDACTYELFLAAQQTYSMSRHHFLGSLLGWVGALNLPLWAS